MIENKSKSALIVIDMENSFIDEKSPHCIKGAKATIPACSKAIETARKKGIPVFFVKRIYRTDGSDVEMTRYNGWKDGGRGMGPSSTGYNSAQTPEGLKPKKGDYTIIKPRWSAFFHTELDLILRRLNIRTVILIGTTTPNCIRTSCYDANSLEYNVVLIEDCCSSATPEIQKANIDDMRRMGATIINSDEFEDYDENTVVDLNSIIFSEIMSQEIAPEEYTEYEKDTGWFDRW